MANIVNCLKIMTTVVFFRCLAIWLLMVVLETIHGIVRQRFLAPTWGDLPARQIGVVIGSSFILLIAFFSYEWIGARSVKQQLTVGALWVTLMVGFEIGLGLLLGMSSERLLSDYNIAKGGYMSLGLVVLWLSLTLVSKFRSRDA